MHVFNGCFYTNAKTQRFVSVSLNSTRFILNHKCISISHICQSCSPIFFCISLLPSPAQSILLRYIIWLICFLFISLSIRLFIYLYIPFNSSTFLSIYLSAFLHTCIFLPFSINLSLIHPLSNHRTDYLFICILLSKKGTSAK